MTSPQTKTVKATEHLSVQCMPGESKKGRWGRGGSLQLAVSYECMLVWCTLGCASQRPSRRRLCLPASLEKEFTQEPWQQGNQTQHRKRGKIRGEN